MDQPPPPPQKRGCLFYGCVTLIVLFLLGGFGLFLGYRSLQRFVFKHTDSAPMQLERAELPPTQQALLQERIDAFAAALESGTNVHELVLNSAEINALIAKKKELAGKLFVAIEEDRIKGQISWPLPSFGPFRLKGRYLNGEGIFRAAFEEGGLIVTLDEVRVKGRALSGPFMSGLRGQNLASDVQTDPETAAAIRKFDSILVTNGTVVLRNRLLE